MKSILFLTAQDVLGEIQNGGTQCAERNYKLLKAYTGEENLYVRIIWNKEQNNSELQKAKYFKRISNNKEALISSFFMSKTYLPSEFKKIVQDINSVNPDILFLDSSLLGKVLRKINSNIIKIVFFHNLESEYARHKVLAKGLHFLPSYIAALYNEKCVMKYADWKICLNQRDSVLLKHRYGKAADLLLPICFEDRFSEKKICCNPEEKKLLFIGSFFPPNYDGIKWFVEEVMSELKEYKLLIVGKDFELKREQLSRNNVEVIGTVKNLDSYYYRYAVMVMPILYGDGMKVKTAEAMMFGKTIFATSEALEGYEIKEIPSGVYCCNSREEFIWKIREAFSDKEIEPFNNNVRNYFLKYHSINKQILTLNDFLDCIIRGKG